MTTTELIEFFFNVGIGPSGSGQEPLRYDFNRTSGNPIPYAADFAFQITLPAGGEFLTGRPLQFTVQSAMNPLVILLKKTTAAGNIIINSVVQCTVVLAEADTLLPAGIGTGGFFYTLRDETPGGRLVLAFGDFEVTYLSPG